MNRNQLSGILAVAVLLVAGTTSVAAQEKKIARKEVPAPVLAAFEKSFPNAKVVGYSREVEDGKTLYEIESKEGTMTRDATFTPEGTLAIVEESLPASALPKPVADAFKKQHPEAQLTLAEKVTEGKKVFYELHIKEGGKSLEAKYNPDGSVTK